MANVLYCHLLHHNHTIIKTQEDFFRKNICTSHFICKGSKRVTRGFRARGSWRPNRNCNTLTHCYGRQRCVFLVPLMLNRRPRGLLCWVIVFFTASLPQAPSALCGFPYQISSITPSHSNWNSVLTELYNSPTSTQSPTRFLESHVWSSLSGNNCHAVHRSLSLPVHQSMSVPWEFFFTSSHFISQFPPTRFPLITAIRMCHLLPVHLLGMVFLAGSKAKIQHMCWIAIL